MTQLQKIYFEYPSAWIKAQKVNQMNFIQNIIQTGLSLNVELTCIPTPFPSYGVSRLPSEHLLISFHSYDNPGNVISYKEAPINGLFSLDRKGYAGWSDIALDLNAHLSRIQQIAIKEAKETLAAFKTQLIGGDSKHPQLKEALPSVDQYILFPLQVRTDSVARLANLDMLHVLKTMSALAKQYQKHVVVKLHPFCNSEVTKCVQFIESEQNPFLHVSNAHIIKLIEKADKVVACNSGASLEALILGKDVSCFGKSEWYEITHKLETDADLEALFTRPPQSGLTAFQKQYLTYLLKHYWVKDTDAKAIKDIITQALSNSLGSEPCDLYSHLTQVLLDKQQSLEFERRKFESIEKDFAYMQDILSYFRRRPWQVLKYFFKDRAKKLKAAA